MNAWLPKSDPDRIESLKAALVTGTAAGGVAAILLWGRRVVALGAEAALDSVWAGLAGGSFWVSVVIAMLSGSLFGITYRYAVRQDENLQINLGVIFAFALVRGLALVNTAAALSLRGWPFLTGIGESVLMFVTAAVALELAFRMGGIKKVNTR